MQTSSVVLQRTCPFDVRRLLDTEVTFQIFTKMDYAAIKNSPHLWENFKKTIINIAEPTVGRWHVDFKERWISNCLWELDWAQGSWSPTRGCQEWHWNIIPHQSAVGEMFQCVTRMDMSLCPRLWKINDGWNIFEKPWTNLSQPSWKH